MRSCIDPAAPGGRFAKFTPIEVSQGIDKFSPGHFVELQSLIERERGHRVGHDSILQLLIRHISRNTFDKHLGCCTIEKI
jgi:hypothetical protein